MLWPCAVGPGRFVTAPPHPGGYWLTTYRLRPRPVISTRQSAGFLSSPLHRSAVVLNRDMFSSTQKGSAAVGLVGNTGTERHPRRCLPCLGLGDHRLDVDALCDTPGRSSSGAGSSRQPRVGGAVARGD